MTFQLPYADKIKIPTTLSFLWTTFKVEPQLWLWYLGGTFFYMLTGVKGIYVELNNSSSSFIFWKPGDICLNFSKKSTQKHDRTGICTGTKNRFSPFLIHFNWPRWLQIYFYSWGYEWIFKNKGKYPKKFLVACLVYDYEVLEV
jgi:hypothetical protein